MDTQQKYNEAEFFLELIKEHIADRQKLEYSISAFLSAARSITFYLARMFDTKSKFNDWYFGKEQKDKTGVLEFFRTMRNCNVHEKPINPRSDISIAVGIAGVVSTSVKAVVRGAQGNIKNCEYSESPAKPKPASKLNSREETKYKWFFKDWQESDEDVITLCERYLKKLKIIVEEAESEFGEANTLQKQLTDK